MSGRREIQSGVQTNENRGGGGGGRGRGRGGNRARGRGKGNQSVSGQKDHHVAKPNVTELPTNLQFSISMSPIPPPILQVFPEFSKAQTFFSALERFYPDFEESHSGYKHCWCGISGEQITSIERDEESNFLATLNLADGKSQSVFMKRIHLLEPVNAMKGEYLWPEDGALSAPSEIWKMALEKINEPMNEAYVDSIFALYASKLVEGGYSPNWCLCYGTFSARVEKYIYNISDEYTSMKNSSWWKRNQRLGLFSLYNEASNETENENTPSAFFTEGLEMMESSDFIEMTDDQENKNKNKNENECDELIECDTFESNENESNSVVLSTPKIRLKRMNNSNSSGSYESEYDCQQFVEFRNFPVQVTLLERATGTIDELIDEETNDETKDARWSAWLFQIISALVVAQHWFGFVHNDLHTNNVMWVNTEEEYIYYRIQKMNKTTYMRIPTHGRIMKIIDFGRSSFTLPDPIGFFISDAFFPGNDAANQYNCEPFYDKEDGKKIEPNPSFDLCRLSVSMIESLYSDRPEPVKPVKIMTREDGGKKLYTETISPVYNLLWSWLQDDSGKNVLRNPNGEERYPDFTLYQAIAADVHCAVPKHQIEKPIFRDFLCEEASIPKNTPIYTLSI